MVRRKADPTPQSRVGPKNPNPIRKPSPKSEITVFTNKANSVGLSEDLYQWAKQFRRYMETLFLEQGDLTLSLGIYFCRREPKTLNIYGSFVDATEQETIREFNEKLHRFGRLPSHAIAAVAELGEGEGEVAEERNEADFLVDNRPMKSRNNICFVVALEWNESLSSHNTLTITLESLRHHNASRCQGVAGSHIMNAFQYAALKFHKKNSHIGDIVVTMVDAARIDIPPSLDYPEDRNEIRLGMLKLCLCGMSWYNQYGFLDMENGRFDLSYHLDILQHPILQPLEDSNEISAYRYYDEELEEERILLLDMLRSEHGDVISRIRTYFGLKENIDVTFKHLHDFLYEKFIAVGYYMDFWIRTYNRLLNFIKNVTGYHKRKLRLTFDMREMEDIQVALRNAGLGQCTLYLENYVRVEAEEEPSAEEQIEEDDEILSSMTQNIESFAKTRSEAEGQSVPKVASPLRGESLPQVASPLWVESLPQVASPLWVEDLTVIDEHLNTQPLNITINTEEAEAEWLDPNPINNSRHFSRLLTRPSEEEEAEWLDPNPINNPPPLQKKRKMEEENYSTSSSSSIIYGTQTNKKKKTKKKTKKNGGRMKTKRRRFKTKMKTNFFL